MRETVFRRGIGDPQVCILLKLSKCGKIATMRTVMHMMIGLRLHPSPLTHHVDVSAGND